MTWKVIKKFEPGIKTIDGCEVVFAFVGADSVLDKLVLYSREHNMENVVVISYQDKESARGIRGVSCPSNVL